MSRNEQIELVLLRLQQGYYKKPIFATNATNEINILSEPNQITEIQHAIHAINSIFETGEIK